MLVKTAAVVLRSIKYGESSLIVDVLTEKSGRVSFIVRVPKTSKSRVKKQYFQPLTILDLEYFDRARSTLQHIRDARIAVPYSTIPFDPIKSSLLFFLSEFLFYVTQSEQENAALFRYIVNSLEWLDASSEGLANFHLLFMARLSRFVGFYPNLTTYREGSFFDLRNGCFSPKAPLHTDFLSSADATFVINLMRMNYETMHLFKFTHEERNRIAALILYYYRLHIPNMPELRSFSILKDVFS
ncbi:DNA repair protein RecO [Prevotella brunnea]|uniref:DNA repair protein RecO n=1 Tax=Prevotella brunnea TaxID=2508867 RepID=A0A5C8GKI0_9BACT|nr:DNA repair protein RecO [Prevotella brunnea]MDR0186952.1 DNA repair protein RecO [Prevotella brunnea]TXJ62549.1 DNA repair protein RecO [Prevotella brunnea]